MKREELTKTFMMISNCTNTLCAIYSDYKYIVLFLTEKIYKYSFFVLSNFQFLNFWSIYILFVQFVVLMHVCVLVIDLKMED